MSDDFEVHKGSLVYKDEKFSIIECDTCQFKHIMPLPEQKELDQLYKGANFIIQSPWGSRVSIK